MSHLQEEDRSSRNDLPKAYNKKLIFLAAFLLVDLLLVLSIFAMPQIKYGKANKNVSKGNYEKAIEQYAELGDYKQAVQRLKVAQGLAAIQEGKTVPAIAYIMEQGVSVDATFDPGEGKMAQSLPGGTVRYRPGGPAPELPEAEKEGYQFDQWTLDELSYQPGKTDKVSITLRALFTTVKYAIHYEGGQGMENPNPDEYDCESTDISLLPPTWKGYEFVGWTWDGQDTPEMNAIIPQGSKGEKTFVSHWEGKSYQVTLDANGGTVSPQVKTVTMGKPANLPTPTLKGYAFQGWSQGGLLIHNESAWCVSEDTSAKAMWKAKNYTISLDADEGICSTKSISVTYDYNYSLPTPTKEGYEFKGWFYGNTQYSGGIWKTDGSITLKAGWKGKQYTVTLNPNEGTLNQKTITVTMGEGYTLPTPTRKGYTFKGWQDATGKNVAASGKWETPKEMALTAQWEQAKYTLTIDPNGGTYSGNRSVTVKYEEKVKLGTVSKENNEFLGWYIDGVKVELNGKNEFKYTYETNKTVMAHWEENEAQQPPASPTDQ